MCVRSHIFTIIQYLVAGKKESQKHTLYEETLFSRFYECHCEENDRVNTSTRAWFTRKQRKAVERIYALSKLSLLSLLRRRRSNSFVFFFIHIFHFSVVAKKRFVLSAWIIHRNTCCRLVLPHQHPPLSLTLSLSSRNSVFTFIKVTRSRDVKEIAETINRLTSSDTFAAL